MQRFKNIVCVVSSNMESAVALDRALALAESNQASLTVVEVVEDIPPKSKLFGRIFPVAEVQEKIVSDRLQRLDALVAGHQGDVKAQSKVLTGIPFLEIIREVLHNGRDLVIKTAESSVLDRVFGSDDMHLLRKCPCPVWLVKSTSPKAYRRILAAVDVDDFYLPEELNVRHKLNVQILEMASSLALADFAELHVVHVWDAIGESVFNLVSHDTPEEKIAAYVEQVRRQNATNLSNIIRDVTRHLGQDALNYLRPRSHLIKGAPRREVPALAEKIQADLVVMGTVARTGIPGFIIGNTAETILNRIDCSVLAIKPPGFKTPVTLSN